MCVQYVCVGMDGWVTEPAWYMDIFEVAQLSRNSYSVVFWSFGCLGYLEFQNWITAPQHVSVIYKMKAVIRQLMLPCENVWPFFHWRKGMS